MSSRILDFKLEFSRSLINFIKWHLKMILQKCEGSLQYALHNL